MDKKQQKLTTEQAIQIWEKTVDTQMHFNEMSVKSRQLGLAFVVAALGLAVVLLSQGKGFSLAFLISGKTWLLHIAVLVTFAAAFAMYAVRLLDINVYHKMLRGAVTFGEDFEQSHLLPLLGLNKGMTQAISHFSRMEDASVIRTESPYRYVGTMAVSALDKIKSFYFIVILSLLGVAVLIFIVTNLQPTVVFNGEH
jgi:hypothetical protein